VNSPITVGAIVLIVSLAALFAAVRAWPMPDGRHRATAAAPLFRAVLDEQSLDGLLGPWPEPPYAAVVAQQWLDCPDCGTAEPGIRNKDGWWCGHCLHPVSAVIGDVL
jgi:hypothetical protein